MATNHLEILLKCRFWFCRHRMRWDSAFSMSSYVMPMLLIHGPHWVQFSSVTQSCPTLCHPMDCSTQASLSFTNSWSLLKLMSIKSVMPPNHLILCNPLLLLTPIFPSIKVFSNELVLCIRWPKLVHEPHWVVNSKLIEFIALLWSQMAQTKCIQSIHFGKAREDFSEEGMTTLNHQRWTIC